MDIQYKYLYKHKLDVEDESSNYFIFPHMIREINSVDVFYDNFVHSDLSSYHLSEDKSGQYYYFNLSNILFNENKEILVYHSISTDINGDPIIGKKSFIFTDLLNEQYELGKWITYTEEDLSPQLPFYMFRLNKLSKGMNILYFNEYNTENTIIESNYGYHLLGWYTPQSIYLNMFDELDDESKFILQHLLNKKNYYQIFNI